MNYTPEEISILERIAIAKNPKTPKNVLKELANDPEKNVRLFVAANVNTPQTVLTTLASVAPRYVATNPNTAAKVLTQLAKTHPEYVVSNSNAPESLLKKLAESSSVIVRYYLAANPHAPVSVLRKLAANEYEESPLVLENVAWNPNAPEDLLADIRESRTKWAIVTEIDPYLDVEKIGNDYQIACHINTSLSTLEKLAKHENWIVRYLVINNPNTPKSLADAIVSEIAQTTSLPDDSRKCLVLNMLGKMPSYIPFKSSSGFPMIAIADEIVDFRWHDFGSDSFIFYNYNTESKIIGLVQKGEVQSKKNINEFYEGCRFININNDDFQVDGGNLIDRFKNKIYDELADNFVYFQGWLSREGFLFTPYTYDFLEICAPYTDDNEIYDQYWNLGSYRDREEWLDEYLTEGIECCSFMEEYESIFDSDDFNDIVEKMPSLIATHQEHSGFVLDFWNYIVLNNQSGTPIFDLSSFLCNPEYDIQSMIEKLKPNSQSTTKNELKATISRLLKISPLADDEDEIIAALAKHRDLVIEVSGLQIVRDSDEIDKNNENGLYFYIDDTCIDYDSFVATQNWDSLFEKTEDNKLLPYIAYLLIKIILFNKSGEN